MDIKRKTIENDEEYLRQISIPVSFEDEAYKEDIKLLEDFCLKTECFALAPVQMGIPKRMIFIRNTSTDMTKNDESYNEGLIYINPVIKGMYGHTRFLEGCGSCKYSNGNYVVGLVDRPYKIDIEYYDINGIKKDKTIEGFESTIFCHEYDHLNGILHMDYLDESFLMTLDQMKDYRSKYPYEIISKDGEYKPSKRKK